MKVSPKIVLVPDMYGERRCKDCKGYGWTYGFPGYEPEHVECPNCEGKGSFREETWIVPIEGDLTLRSAELTRDDYGRYVHTACSGGGVRFFTQRGSHYWSCASCKKRDELTAPEWEIAQAHQAPLNLFANAKGAELLATLRGTQ